MNIRKYSYYLAFLSHWLELSFNCWAVKFLFSVSNHLFVLTPSLKALNLLFHKHIFLKLKVYVLLLEHWSSIMIYYVYTRNETVD